MKFKLGKPTIGQAIWVATAIVVCIGMSCWLFRMYSESNADRKELKVDPTVQAFWDDYFSGDFKFYEEGNTLYRFMAGLEGMVPEDFAEYPAGASDIEEDFREVTNAFVPDGVGAVKSYDITQAGENFCVLHLYDGEGQSINPPVGFWYKLTQDGKKIQDYYLARLQPFSRYDEEFSEDWDAVN